MAARAAADGDAVGRVLRRMLGGLGRALGCGEREPEKAADAGWEGCWGREAGDAAGDG